MNRALTILTVALVAGLVTGAPPSASANGRARPAPVTPPFLRIHFEPCPDGSGSPACAYMDAGSQLPGEQIGDVYVGPHPVPLFVLEHEIGHEVDAQLLTAGDRRWFMRRLGFNPDGAWITGSGFPDGLTSPHERFADAFATCQLGWTPNGERWESAYDYNPTPRQHRRICAAIMRVGQRAR